MTKKSKQKQGDAQDALKSEEKTTKRLSVEDALRIQSFDLKKEIHEKDLKIIALERQICELSWSLTDAKCALQRRDLAESESKRRAKIEGDKIHYKNLIESIKAIHGISGNLSYDPDSLELTEV